MLTSTKTEKTKRNTNMTTTTEPSPYRSTRYPATYVVSIETRYPATYRLFTLLDEERVTPGQVIDMLVNYLSEDEIADMLDMNELSLRFDEDEDDADESEDIL